MIYGLDGLDWTAVLDLALSLTQSENQSGLMVWHATKSCQCLTGKWKQWMTFEMKHYMMHVKVTLSNIQHLHFLLVVCFILDTLNHQVGRNLNDNNSTFKWHVTQNLDFSAKYSCSICLKGGQFWKMKKIKLNKTTMETVSNIIWYSAVYIKVCKSRFQRCYRVALHMR